MPRIFAGIFASEDGFKVRAVHLAASLLIVAAICAAGADAFPPVGRPPAPAAQYRSVGAKGADMPVFTLDDDGFPLQCGRAEADGEHLTIHPYASGRAALDMQENTALLMDADLRSLWALLPDRQRDELRVTFGDFVASFRVALRRTLQSPAFEREYRPPLKDILGRALGQAFASSAVRSAWMTALASTDQKALDDLLSTIRPIAVDKAESLLWDTVSGYTINLFEKKGEPDRGVITQVLTETLKDARSQDALAQALPALMDTPEMNAFVAALSTEFAAALFRDERFLPLLSRMVNDVYVVADADARMVGHAAQSFLHTLPAKFIGLRHSGDHNALAAFVLTTLAKGRQGRFVVLASPRHAQRLTTSGSVRILARIDPQ